MNNTPLAIKLRPEKLKDIVGQTHLVGKDKIITNLVKNKQLMSLILYGKPGIGKTSIAMAIVNELDLRYRMLNAVINNKKDFDKVVEEAKFYNGMIVIMDEIHRLNKDKQDLLLPYLESGIITLIGMTTANPYHKINPAIRSRCHILELKDLTEDDIYKGLKNAIKKDILKNIKAKDSALKLIAKKSGFDLRYAYNILELAYNTNKNKEITIETIKELNLNQSFFHDMDEDGHYNVLSAFQKSIRGSDVNAALHYLARLIQAGDLDSIYRRLSVIIYEDIGLANPNLGPRLDAAINAAERVGLPEARIPLSNIVVEAALSPKSNSAYSALDKAIKTLEIKNISDIPKHILNTPNNGYLYPHNYKNSYIKQQYLPDQIKDDIYYIPKTTSKYEQTLKQINDNLNKLKEDK